jgi:hypothetical protein
VPRSATFRLDDGLRLRALCAGQVALILGILQLLAGAGAMVGNQLARWTGVGLVCLNLIAEMLFIPAYPFWSLMIIAVDVVALYALCVYGSRANLAA